MMDFLYDILLMMQNSMAVYQPVMVEVVNYNTYLNTWVRNVRGE